jgi:hypothetical protein
MSLGLAYWIGIFIWLIFGFWSAGWTNIKASGGNLLLFILLVLIGWRVFGAPLHT